MSDAITALFHSMRVALLDGSDPTNEWIDHPAGSTPGRRRSALPDTVAAAYALLLASGLCAAVCTARALPLGRPTVSAPRLSDSPAYSPRHGGQVR